MIQDNELIYMREPGSGISENYFGEISPRENVTNNPRSVCQLRMIYNSVLKLRINTHLKTKELYPFDLDSVTQNFHQT